MDGHPPRSSRVLCPRISGKFASFAKKETARDYWLLLAERDLTRRLFAGFMLYAKARQNQSVAA
jgi:hypothetical protein